MIVTLGDLTLDILVKPDHKAPGQPADSPGSVTMTSGGAAAHFAVWVSRLGGNCRFIGKLGMDPAAELLLWDLLKEGVLPETPSQKGSTATLVHMVKKGESSFMPDRGVAVDLRPDEVQGDWLADAQWLHLPAPALWAQPIASATAKAVRLARKAGAPVSLDLESAAGLREYGVGKFTALLKTIRPDVIFATQDQAMLFEAGALGAVAGIAVLKLGAEGCAASDDGGYREFPGQRGHRADLAGAGEAFDAAWCLAYLQTTSVQRACAAANRLWSLVAGHHGPRPKVDLRGVLG